MVILENKIVPNARAWFLFVTNTLFLTYLKTTPGKEPPIAYNVEHFEDITPMAKQPSNVNQLDELEAFDKWVRFLSQDEAHGELGTNNGNSGLTHAFWDAWKSVMELEGTCMAIISSMVLAAPRYTLT